MQKIHYLIIKYRNTYTVYSPNTFGAKTWGSNDQESIEKKRKHWYYVNWRACPYEDGDDWNEQYKLNVVYETTELADVFNYLQAHNSKDLEKNKAQIKDILDTQAMIQQWYKQ